MSPRKKDTCELVVWLEPTQDPHAPEGHQGHHDTETSEHCFSEMRVSAITTPLSFSEQSDYKGLFCFVKFVVWNWKCFLHGKISYRFYEDSQEWPQSPLTECAWSIQSTQCCFYCTELSPRWKTQSPQSSLGHHVSLSLQAAASHDSKGRGSSSAF